MDTHLDLDFLPRHLVYDYGNFNESKHMMEKVLNEILELNSGESPKLNDFQEDLDSTNSKSKKNVPKQQHSSQKVLRESMQSKRSSYNRNIFSKVRNNESGSLKLPLNADESE